MGPVLAPSLRSITSPHVTQQHTDYETLVSGGSPPAYPALCQLTLNRPDTKRKEMIMAQSPAPKTFGTSAGILPISATAPQKNTASKASSSKAATPRLKLLVRRLPPGLTKEEFDVALGDDWKLGG